MTSTFSDYVRSLGPDGEPPCAAAMEELLAALRAALVHEMKKRALWLAPPSYLGVYGGTSWSESDLLEDLLCDCYLFTFVRRLPALKKQLLVRPNVDGLVFLNVRNFLHEAQRRHDPLGYRLFEVARKAVARLVDEGRLHAVEGDPRLRNATVLGFASWSDPQAAQGLDLGERVDAWCDELLPELVTAWTHDEVAARLAERIPELFDDGVEAFRFHDLLEPMKAEVRARWRLAGHLELGETALGEDDGEDLFALVRTVLPDLGFEERQAFDRLLDCTAGRIDGVGGQRRSRDHLHRLWLYLRGWAAEGGEPEDERLPSDKRLGELLGIPRIRLPELKSTLGGLLETCREASSATAATGPPAAVAARREALRRDTGVAAARCARRLNEAAERGAEPAPGEVFFVDANRGQGFQWALVERHPQSWRLFYAVAVDYHPLAGHGDVAWEEEAAVLRCARGVWADAGSFAAPLRTGVVPEEVLERVRRRRRELDDDDEIEAWIHGETENDSEHCLLHDQLAVATATFPSQAVLPFRPRSKTAAVPRRSRVVPTLSALAAGLAFVALSLVWQVGERQRTIDELSRPAVVGSSQTREIRFGDDPRGEVLIFAPGEEERTLYLVLAGVADYPSYRLRLLDDGGAEVWRAEIAHDPLDEFLLKLPRRGLRTAAYRLEVAGLRDRRPEVLEEREVRIELR